MQTEQVLHKILNELQTQSGQSNPLWNAADIAAFTRLSKSTIQNRVIKHPTFPRAIILPSGRDAHGGGRRWVASEVRQWALRHRESREHIPHYSELKGILKDSDNNK